MVLRKIEKPAAQLPLPGLRRRIIGGVTKIKETGEKGKPEIVRKPDQKVWDEVTRALEICEKHGLPVPESVRGFFYNNAKVMGEYLLGHAAIMDTGRDILDMPIDSTDCHSAWMRYADLYKVASVLYYKFDLSIMEDAHYDRLCKRLLECFPDGHDEFDHVSREALSAGTGFDVEPYQWIVLCASILKERENEWPDIKRAYLEKAKVYAFSREAAVAKPGLRKRPIVPTGTGRAAPAKDSPTPQTGSRVGGLRPRSVVRGHGPQGNPR